jgi:tRNA (guanine37-N1)-methyltransferase
MLDPVEASSVPVVDDSTIRSLSDFPDRNVFRREDRYPALNIPVRRTAELRKTLKHVLWRRPKTKNVYDDETDPQRRILVLANIDEDAFRDETVQRLIQHEDCRKASYTVTTAYENYTVEEILKQLLPNESEIPSAFEMVGHLAHVNLRSSQLPFKYWIGKVMLDKNQPRIRTVVNKLGTIETEYRTFGMEVIAGYQGENWSVVTVKEERCAFRLDFTKVYWNSRLAGEHRRLVQQILKESQTKPLVVADLMAGVGPFAVPLTASHGRRNQVTVYANDLNPESYKYLLQNVQSNKCTNIHCYNQCGRAMVHQLQAENIEVDHVIMNLPASAPEFLDAFRGYEGVKRPCIHVHCFAPKASEATDYQDALDRCSSALGCTLDRISNDVHVHVVRDVSPNKNMLSVSFLLPVEAQSLVKMKLQPLRTETSEPGAKRIKSN